VVQDRRLRRACRARVVMTRDCVQELRAHLRIERGGVLLHGAQTEVHVSEQPAFVGLPEDRPATELERAADIVDESSCEQEVATQTRMKLSRLAAERRDADRVLEQTACVGVVAVRRRWIRGEVVRGKNARNRLA
jgi:hypothetical protein